MSQEQEKMREILIDFIKKTYGKNYKEEFLLIEFNRVDEYLNNLYKNDTRKF